MTAASTKHFIPLAEVARKAVNLYLSEHGLLLSWGSGQDKHGRRLKADAFSCNALCSALFSTISDLFPKANFETKILASDKLEELIRSMGCNIDSAHLFTEWAEGPERQMARAIWLSMIEVVAEDENLTIEVEYADPSGNL